MNYQKHYELLCERAKDRQLDCYTENHHIIPRCLGGDDSPENLVALTPEEHYIAHQLLVKIHPNHQGLIWAALVMAGHSQNDHRNTNKVYGWLKRKWSQECKKRKGVKNGSFGRAWYHHPETLENKKCLSDEVPEGFVKGRVMNKQWRYKRSELYELYLRNQQGESLDNLVLDLPISRCTLWKRFQQFSGESRILA